MPKMIVEWIRPHCFRAFGKGEPIVLEDQLTIFYGGNATGKSSLAEAVEWLLLGYTTRRRKGDDLSKEEYRGSYARNMQDCPSTPFVEAQIRLSDGTTHLVRRTMLLPEAGRFDDTRSELTIDGEPGTFSDVGLSVLPVYNPVVTQHGIQDFIHTRPIDRYRAISDALGLTDLVGLKDALESARSAYRANPPDLVTRATSAVGNLPSHLRVLRLEEMATRWSNQEYNLEDDYSEIQSSAADLAKVEPELTPDQLFPTLRNEQAREMQRVFDISPFRPRTDSDDLLNELQESSAAFRARIRELVKAAQAVLEVTLTEFEQKRIAFWKTGLEDVWDESRPERCPFCEEDTVTESLITERRAEIAKARGSTRKKNDLEKRVEACHNVGREIAATVGLLRPRSLSTQHRKKLRSVFEHSHEILEEYLEVCEAFDSTAEYAVERLKELDRRIDDLREIALGPQAGTLPELASKLVQETVDLVLSFSEAFKDYWEAFSGFEPVLRVELADEDEVKKYTAAIALLEERESVEICAAQRQLEDDLLDRQRAVTAYVKEKQEEVLKTREAEMLSWFDRLSPGSPTSFSGIEPATDRFILKADSFGAELSAPACLSHSQLNCLGLSIWIPSVTAPLSPFQFLLFDDPVQAMDDEHAQSFIVTTVPHLIEREGIQVIVLTHLEGIADRLRQELYHLRHRFYRFDTLSADGVRLDECHYVRDELRQIKQLMASDNEASRKLAVDRIRVLSEHIMREAYLKERGVPLPDEYASATASALLKPFCGLASVSPKQQQGLRATIHWADPAHHTDKKWQTPSSSNIEPHLHRVEKLATDLGLL